MIVFGIMEHVQIELVLIIQGLHTLMWPVKLGCPLVQLTIWEHMLDVLLNLLLVLLEELYKINV